jgi:hypothetical protein
MPHEPPRSISLSPQLCVCVLSCQRLDLLRTTLHAIVHHLETVERGLPYELVWVDNGSNDTERQALHREFTFEKALMLGANYGMAYGFNTLFFRLCSAPYFITLEEDWEWLGERHGIPVGHTALADAMSVLRHDTGVSGVFLRPDTLDQFLTRSDWKRAPRHAASLSAASTGAATVAANGATTARQQEDDVEYATYCMDRGASYLWGAYSNGPGVYDRTRLMRLVGRQYGEPGDEFPDPASESNYCYRVGAAGLCSAVMRIWPTCNGVHECNMPLFRHLGDERSHGYGKGRKPDIRWLVFGSNYSYDPQMVQLRSLGFDPSLHWLSLSLTQGGHSSAPAIGDGTVAVLVAAKAQTLSPVERMARAALAAARAPEQVLVMWLAPVGRPELLDECTMLSSTLADEISGVRGVTAEQRPLTAVLHPLRCVVSPSGRDAASLAERFAVLAAATNAQLLLLCPRFVSSFGAVRGATDGNSPALTVADGGAGGAGTAEAAKSSRGVLGQAWDDEARTTFSGQGDVRHFRKDRVMMMQAMPPDGSALPSGHALVHRDAMEHLDHFAPPHTGDSWLLFSLSMQHMFGSVGRHGWLGNGQTRFTEADDDVAAGTSTPQSGQLRQRFERAAGARAIDTHRLDSAILLLKPKSRTAFDGATAAYARFSSLYNAGALVEAWPTLAELTWSLEAVERSDDWELRNSVGPSMLPAAQDLQARVLDQFAAAGAAV